MHLFPLPEIDPRQYDPNPMVRAFGYDQAGHHCGDCCHLRRFKQSAVWFKCELRGSSRGNNGRSTDHRYRWKACAKFNP